jgi:thiol-disulfide isomerase/thioredoxin
MKFFQVLFWCMVQSVSLAQPISPDERAFDSILQMKRNCVGKPFGTFKALSLTGKRYTPQHLAGKVVFITFWFTACKPCMEELPDLLALYKKYEATPSFIFLSFTIDDRATAMATVKKYRLPYPVLPVAPELAQNLNCMNGYPTNFIIDQWGNVAAKYSGVDMFGQKDFFKANIHPKIDSLLQLKKP